MLPAVAKKSAMIALARVVSRDGEAYDGKTKRAAQGGPFRPVRDARAQGSLLQLRILAQQCRASHALGPVASLLLGGVEGHVGALEQALGGVSGGNAGHAATDGDGELPDQ